MARFFAADTAARDLRLAQKDRSKAERCAAVIRFLRSHPNSTSDEVVEACKCSVDNAQKYTKRFRHHKTKRFLYAVDEVKLLRCKT